MLIDAHCHFDFPHFDGRRTELVSELREQGVCALVIPGVRSSDWQRVQHVANAQRELFYCVGIHPWYIDEHDQRDLDRLEEFMRAAPERCVGIGECGLDRLRGSFEQQMPWFDAQIRIAAEYQQALVIHSVKAHDEVVEALKAAAWHGKALVHGFSGSYEQAVKLLDLGCMLGVGGVITHSKGGKTRDALARVPASALVLETDAPDMAPAGVEHGQNSPEYLPQILRELALLRNESEPELAAVLLENTCRLYGSALRAGLAGPQLGEYRN